MCGWMYECVYVNKHNDYLNYANCLQASTCSSYISNVRMTLRL